MAIAYDTAVAGKNWENANSWTFAHNCGGSDRFLSFGFMGHATGDSVTGATYNGDAMTRLMTGNDFASANRFYTYYIANPDSGSNNIVVSSSSTVSASIESSSYTGVHQTTPVDSYYYNSGSRTTTFTLSTTVVASNCWLVSHGRDFDGAFTPSSPNTERVSTSTVAMIASDSDGTVGTGSQSLVWTSGGSNRIGAYMILSIAPAVASGPANLKTLNTNAKANIKSINTNLIANVKSLNTNV